jgi:hypothetical protein
MASGLTLALSIGIGGTAVPLLGLVADASGLTATLAVVVGLTALTLLLSLLLPADRPRRARALAAPSG